MLPENWGSLRRVLAIRLDNIGDVVMLGPALRALKHALPETRITLMASPAGSQVSEMLPWVDDVMTHRALWQDVSGALSFDPARELTLVEEIKRRRFDAAFVFTSFSQSPYPAAYLCYLAEIPVRVGQSKEFGGQVLSDWIKPLPDNVHQVDRNLHLLESCGLRVDARQLELRIPREAQVAADHLLEEMGLADQSFIVLAPGASAQARRYLPENFSRVAQRLNTRTGLPVVVIGTANEKEWVQAVVAHSASGGVLSLAGRTSVAEMARIIQRGRAVVANDSGPMHIADALNRPMVILFSGTDDESQWEPRRAPARLLRRPTDCAPCYQFRCPFSMECLDIPPEEVVSVAMEMLGESEKPHYVSAELVWAAEG